MPEEVCRRIAVVEVKHYHGKWSMSESILTSILNIGLLDFFFFFF